MRDFCKPISKEKQIEARRISNEYSEKAINKFNKKYLDKGEAPPLHEVYYNANCITRIYPNGRIEHTFRHLLKIK